ncbi:putative mediator of RNA polymerase II transcription subunit 26 isoform X2 [Pararge aegeria]|uniref:Jg13308 protein n=1 Tax=Pararge aegeria aegeria TaxID=348720 RepID=A0A8S4RGW5_9NEOP|nr:putative mediator of RNA polymerase II transcription subunit 26 isoform X2 [Pararge aegeria]CAH2235459.1 jg13308 [Pararge aegeria aegeria]
MGYYCTVPQCTSLAGKTKNVKFHRFPRDVPMADKWNNILKRGKPYTKYSKVCSLHFTQADYNATTMGQWKTLSKDAVPSQNLPKLNPDGTVMVIRKSRTVKYKECKKEDQSISCKSEKWSMSQSSLPLPLTPTEVLPSEQQENNLSYRLHTLSSIASVIAPQNTPNSTPHNQIQTIQKSASTQHNSTQQISTQHNSSPHNSTQHNQVQTIQKPRKQDAIMQTDPIQSEEDDQQNSYSESSEKSYNESYATQQYSEAKAYEMPKDFSKTTEDYIPQTNEEYNKEAEKYALERKSHNGYEKMEYPKQVVENGYQKPSEVYTFNDAKDYQNRPEPYSYPTSYQDSVEILRNQQHNLQILQEQHRITENQNFFNENHIKQEIDFGNEEEKFLYERSKEQIDAGSIYDSQRRALEQQRLMDQIQHQVKQEEPESHSSRDVMQPQGSPYYSANVPSNVTGGYYEQLSRPGPELLIAKQNALAAHTQLWQNMKRPFYYSEGAHYNAPQLLQRYEDLSRILQ